MRSRRWTILLPLAALAAGCAISQTAEVAEYRALLDLPAPRQAPAEPLTLREALLLANASNETLSARGEQFLRALIDRRRTAAAFAPTVRLVGAAIRRDPLPDVGGEPIEGDETSAAADGELTWNLFNGMRDVNRYWGDQFRIDRQRNILLDAQEGLLLDVATVFYQILRSEATVRVLENSLVVQDERLLNTRTRLEVGFARSLDVAQTEAQAAETRSTLINARRDVVNARDLLALLINQPVADRPLDEQSPLPEVAEPLDRYLAAAASMRNDIAAAEAAIEAARRDVEVAFGQYYPTVTLNLDTFLYSTPVPNERDWSACLAPASRSSPPAASMPTCAKPGALSARRCCCAISSAGSSSSRSARPTTTSPPAAPASPSSKSSSRRPSRPSSRRRPPTASASRPTSTASLPRTPSCSPSSSSPASDTSSGFSPSGCCARPACCARRSHPPLRPASTR